ncbi:lasso peptide biosynthesis PqqD family chaperone [Goodfellowiella coeruleoviolacea]|uniref:Coenzyme PQQ synthesis protein D (PqqD) n=1 Tax=Goodfellowiella coeruleoviolacea TaxID=334858 RepID=A0AAE3KIP8_9PSEU|nr:lasso peptide biosynthesis PqqD family chaperone [Goodfellowiella coeruleoviolacea]MCP2168680.1 Coenzyme PQQ synthesis protein D (PqqD) [Goodfellowiella coeruleoviolacea]
MTTRLRADVVFTELDDGSVLLDERTGRYYQLNTTATLALRTMLDGGSPHHAAEVLADRYDTSHRRASADIVGLITRLRRLELVTP